MNSIVKALLPWRMWLILKLWPRKHCGMAFVGNRREFTILRGRYEIMLRIRDTFNPDQYERTELYRMLRTIRTHELIQKWSVPEPEITVLEDGTFEVK